MSIISWDSVKPIENNKYEQLAQWNPTIDTKHIAIQTNNKSNVKYLQDNLFLF